MLYSKRGYPRKRGPRVGSDLLLLGGFYFEVCVEKTHSAELDGTAASRCVVAIDGASERYSLFTDSRKDHMFISTPESAW